MKYIITILTLVLVTSSITRAQTGIPFETANTDEYTEFSPSIGENGNVLYFQTNAANDTIPNANGKNHYIMSTKEEGTIFAKIEYRPFLDGLHEAEYSSPNIFNGAPFATYDDRGLYFVSNRDGGLGQNDIYYYDFETRTVVNIGAPINTTGYEGSPSVTKDGKDFYFVRVTKKDVKTMTVTYQIYHTQKQEDGTWSEPEALEAPINTGDEQWVRISPEGKHLMYSSKRSGGKGGFDIYVSKKRDDGTWGFPINLEEINTDADEESMALPVASDEIYYTTNKAGSRDIYRSSLPDVFKKRVTVRGIIVDNTTGEPMEAKVQFYYYETNELVAEVRNNLENGEYVVLLEKGKYNLVAKPLKENYSFYSETIEVTGEDSEIELKEIKIEQIKKDVKMTFQNITFAFNEYGLSNESVPVLKNVLELLEKNQTLRLEISAHTDNVGAEAYNQQLSEKRAQSVIDWLTEAGISKERLVPKGYGESQPIASNDTEENRAKNRRVEIKVLSE